MGGLTADDLATTLYVGTQYLEQIESFVPLPVGTGIITADGERFRVVDSWLSLDKHGRLDLGLHIFLRQVEEADDLPRRIAPDYFRAPDDA